MKTALERDAYGKGDEDINVKESFSRGEAKEIETPRGVSFGVVLKQRLRRERIYELRLRGYSIAQIVRGLGHSSSTVVNDLKHIDRALAGVTNCSKANVILNHRLYTIRTLKLMALEQFDEAVSCERLGYLNTAIRMIKLEIKLLQAAGLLPKH